MSTARRSLTEDDVDRYNHTWTFDLLLLLCLTTWLLPLALFTQGVSESTKLGETQGYNAICWASPHFTQYMIIYSKVACATAFKKAIKGAVYGASNETFEEEAWLVHVQNNESGKDEVPMFEPTVADTKKDKQDVPTNMETNSEEKHFIFVRTPFILFVLALCLKLPHIVWASSCAGLGFSHLLESARAVQVLDVGVRNQVKEELKKAVGQSINTSSFCISVLYLLVKLLTLLVTIAGLFIVGYTLLPGAEGLLRYQNQRSSAAALERAVASRYSISGLVCKFKMRMLQNIQTHAMQCIFTPDSPSATESSTENEIVLIWLYQAIFTILAVLFAVLVAINIIVLMVWVARLVPGPFRRKVFRNTSYPMDAYLLLYMASLNAGPLVSRYLEQCLNLETRHDVQTGDEMKMLQE